MKPQSQFFALAGCRFELLSDRGSFLGLGKVWIGDTLVRSGRLPHRCFTQTYKDSLELSALQLVDVKSSDREVRIHLEAIFRPLPVKLMRDHSFDPVHELGDWNQSPEIRERLDLVLRPAADSFNGREFIGFDYHWHFQGKHGVELFWILDQSSWELDGDIDGATAYSQSACSAPVAHFTKDNSWSTEGILFFLVEQGNQNPIMTHNLPRWASHGSFDFQFKNDHTLIGVFDRVELIRSVLVRDAGKPELKCFDKHLFDQAAEFKTAAKKIMIHRGAKSVVEQQNLWTWIHAEVERRAREEFGLKEEPFIPRIAFNYWANFTVDTYYKDVLPAAVNLGLKQIFVDNLRKSAMTERAPLPGVFNWNMCCGHEYEIAPALGGVPRVKAFIDEAAAHGIQVMSWTNNTQALSSPINNSERDDKGWFVLLEDARQKYGGAYAAVFSVLDLGVEGARRYFVDSHIAIQKQSGLSGYLFDSFYNLGFMPISYRDCKPRTIWRGLLRAMKELQDAGVHFLIESFGPFGAPQHGHPSSYNIERLFICYRVGAGNDYTTVPTGHPLKHVDPQSAEAIFFTLAHMAGCHVPLFVDKQRIDSIWGDAHKRAIADYHAALPHLKTRYLQEDPRAVIWHDDARTRATLFSFADRTLTLPGTVRDETLGETLRPAATYRVQANHVYSIVAPVLPTVV